MDWFIYILAAIYFIVYIAIPLGLIIMTPFVIIEIVNWFRRLYFYIKECWKEKSDDF